MSKGMMQYNAAYFAEQMPELLFVYVARDPSQTMQSILLARMKYYGTDDLLRGTRPKEYKWLRGLGPSERVVGLVYFTEQAIQGQLARIPA